mmetsp:Transcript_10501/g.15768  ORF Transcript_10501/g.15768 Transcript_10501/m.15768 type:complete len:209 (+) Transcript_10501:662-1288(+)
MGALSLSEKGVTDCITLTKMNNSGQGYCRLGTIEIIHRARHHSLTHIFLASILSQGIDKGPCLATTINIGNHQMIDNLMWKIQVSSRHTVRIHLRQQVGIFLMHLWHKFHPFARYLIHVTSGTNIGWTNGVVLTCFMLSDFLCIRVGVSSDFICIKLFPSHAKTIMLSKRGAMLHLELPAILSNIANQSQLQIRHVPTNVFQQYLIGI